MVHDHHHLSGDRLMKADGRWAFCEQEAWGGEEDRGGPGAAAAGGEGSVNDG